jgi:hypothetical protein
MVVSSHRGLGTCWINPGDKLLVGLLKFDIVYSLLAQAGNISPSSSGNRIIQLENQLYAPNQLEDRKLLTFFAKASICSDSFDSLKKSRVK